MGRIGNSLDVIETTALKVLHYTIRAAGATITAAVIAFTVSVVLRITYDHVSELFGAAIVELEIIAPDRLAPYLRDPWQSPTAPGTVPLPTALHLARLDTIHRPAGCLGGIGTERFRDR